MENFSLCFTFVIYSLKQCWGGEANNSCSNPNSNNCNNSNSPLTPHTMRWNVTDGTNCRPRTIRPIVWLPKLKIKLPEFMHVSISLIYKLLSEYFMLEKYENLNIFCSTISLISYKMNPHFSVLLFETVISRLFFVPFDIISISLNLFLLFLSFHCR